MYAEESRLLNTEEPHVQQQQQQPQQLKRVLMYNFNNQGPPGLGSTPEFLHPAPIAPLTRHPDRVDLLKAALTDQAASVEELWIRTNRRFECMEASQAKLVAMLSQYEYENTLLKDRIAKMEQPIKDVYQLLEDERTKSVRDVDFTCQIGTHLARAGIRNEYEALKSELNSLMGMKLVDDLAQSLDEVSVRAQKAARDSADCKGDVVRNYKVLNKLMSSFDSYVAAHDRHEKRQNRELSQARTANARLGGQVKELRQQVELLLQATDIEKEQAVEILN